MEIEFGTEVIDKNGRVLGTVDHLVRNTWTGEVSKFIVRRKSPDDDLFLSPKDVLEAMNNTVKLSVSLGEANEKHKS
jgi:sporulation protein YlmC with PRC-barrel domain